MNTPILPLNIVVSLAMLYPSGLSYMLFYTFSRQKGQTVSLVNMVYTVCTYIGLSILIWFINPDLFALVLPNHWVFYFIAIGVGVLCVYFEFGVIASCQLLKKRSKIKGYKLQSDWESQLNVPLMIIMVIVSITEEIIFRMLLGSAILGMFRMPVFFVIAICAVVYGLNHSYAGTKIVISKTGVGILFGIMYFTSGMSIIIPCIAHVTQNLFLILTSRKNG
ncbi:MAG: CPBP family intramembrane metalloprotease [Chitinivibrionales bacterium]|nr:CPBP family intramembrane metalloprotease [Chitinivibrionales bacterium]